LRGAVAPLRRLLPDSHRSFLYIVRVSFEPVKGCNSYKSENPNPYYFPSLLAETCTEYSRRRDKRGRGRLKAECISEGRAASLIYPLSKH
jgi:hypothetical protein